MPDVRSSGEGEIYDAVNQDVRAGLAKGGLEVPPPTAARRSTARPGTSAAYLRARRRRRAQRAREDLRRRSHFRSRGDVEDV